MLLNSYMPNDIDHWNRQVNISTVFVPYWIQRLLDRNQLDYIDLLNYDKLRKILSIEDMAQLVCLNGYFEHYFIKDLTNQNVGLCYEWYSTRSSVNNTEYDNVICKLAQTQPTVDMVRDRLTLDETWSTVDCNEFSDPLLKVNGEDQSDKFYRIMPLQGRTIFIILEKGILDTLEVRDARFKMVSEYLKALYSVLPMKEVSKYYGAFEHYFNML